MLHQVDVSCDLYYDVRKHKIKMEGSVGDGNSPKRRHGWRCTRIRPRSMFRVRGGGDGLAVALKSITGFWFLGRSVAAMKAATCGWCVRCFLRK